MTQKWNFFFHDDVIKWNNFPRYWPFVTGEFPAQRPVTRSLMFSLISTRINSWVNNGEAGDFRRYRAHYDVIVMCFRYFLTSKANASSLSSYGGWYHDEWIAGGSYSTLMNKWIFLPSTPIHYAPKHYTTGQEAVVHLYKGLPEKIKNIYRGR